MLQNKKPHTLIIGSGCAGLSLALSLPSSHKVTILCKQSAINGSTYYAQGGVAAVLGKPDSIESHVNDTLKVGGGLSKPEAITLAAKEAKGSIDWLIEQGVQFTKQDKTNSNSNFHLNQEGGHSFRRILHTDDATGKSVLQQLLHQAQLKPNIEIIEHQVAIDLIQEPLTKRVYGIYSLNTQTEEIITWHAEHVVLATGGASKVYLYTTNPTVSSGDGIAMAYRAGAPVCNMEFNQFHPTCLFHPNERGFLISEAVRGEGAKLCHADGTQFMHQYSDKAELAGRDIVARAIDHEMKKNGLACVYLDITHRSKEFLQNHFPTIFNKLLSLNIDMSKDMIPVVPAAHYTCGGVITDLHGQTKLPGLYAIGEVANTGIHGANRMASNSLLECLVFAREVAKKITLDDNLIDNSLTESNQNIDSKTISKTIKQRPTINSDEAVVINHNWFELRHLMWNYVGIVRSNKRLERALSRIKLLQTEINDYYSDYKITADSLELRNLVVVSELIVRSALLRKESRGLHYSLDYPNKLPKAVDTIIDASEY